MAGEFASRAERAQSLHENVGGDTATSPSPTVVGRRSPDQHRADLVGNAPPVTRRRSTIRPPAPPPAAAPIIVAEREKDPASPDVHASPLIPPAQIKETNEPEEVLQRVDVDEKMQDSGSENANPLEREQKTNMEKKRRNIELAQVASFGVMAQALRKDILGALDDQGIHNSLADRPRVLDTTITTETGRETRVAPLAESVAIIQLEELGLRDRLTLIIEGKDGNEPDVENPQNNIVTRYQWIKDVTDKEEATILSWQLEDTVQKTVRARENLVAENEGLARSLADKFRGSDSLPIKIPIAKGGLTKAAYMYDWTIGNTFSTCASTFITNELSHQSYGARRAERDERLLQPPDNLKKALTPVSNALGELSMSNIEVTDEAIAEITGLDVDLVHAAQDYLFFTADKQIVRLDEPTAYDGLTVATIGEITPDSKDAIGELVTREDLNRALAQLDNRTRKIIIARYLENISLADVATELGFSRNHVTRLAARGLQQLREAMHVNEERVSETDASERHEIFEYVSTLPYRDASGRLVSETSSPHEDKGLFPRRVALLLTEREIKHLTMVAITYKRYIQGKTPAQIGEELEIDEELVARRLKLFEGKIQEHKQQATSEIQAREETSGSDDLINI